MVQSSSVSAVVDAVDGVPVVWWVDVGAGSAGMPRLCGAWVLDVPDPAERLRALTATRVLVATADGRTLLEKHEVAVERVLDLPATLTAVVAARDELQAAYEDAVATRKNGRSLTAPRWRSLPEPLDVEAAAEAGGDPRTSRALGIARWIDRLCNAWDAIEEQRLARPYMRSLGGPAARPVPAVIEEVTSGVPA
jgi:hypothetical protein